MGRSSRTRTTDKEMSGGPGRSRFRVRGDAQWHSRLQEALGERELAWSVRRIDHWGELFLLVSRDGLRRLRLSDAGAAADGEAVSSAVGEGEGTAASVVRRDQLLAPFAERLANFLAHPRSVYLDIPVDAIGTPFQCAVWSALMDIPAGEVRSYGDVANAIGSPSSSRAVGGACGANPVPLVVPCHRVVGSGGELTGFGLGLAVKERLLDAEAGRRRLPSDSARNSGSSSTSAMKAS